MLIFKIPFNVPLKKLSGIILYNACIIIDFFIKRNPFETYCESEILINTAFT